ncbi:chemotaxis protein CheB [bacterium]|nr:chemotaxis protein CheB [bacterium]MBU1486851.1 chemotaxis protein CheB [bacterium]
MAFKIIVIGASKGGLQALKTVLSALPAEFPLPVVVSQHREKEADESLSQLLQKVSALTVVEAEDKQPILPGQIYLAPGNYHLLIEADSRQSAVSSKQEKSPLPPASCLLPTSHCHFALSTAEPVEYSRPSIDMLFESAAEVYGEGVIAVILTGMNKDGAQGLAAVKQAGGMAIVQDPRTAEASSMPKAAIAATVVDKILPLEEIGHFLAKIVGGGVKRGGRRQKNKRQEAVSRLTQGD